MLGNDPGSLETKLKNAKFADVAGNLATINIPRKVTDDSATYLKNNTNPPADPFDYSNKGFRVIIDAVPPKYTKVGNGIQPEILTGVTLNNKDEILFTVQFTEETIIRTGYTLGETYLLFSNGQKATYVDADDTKKWGNGTKEWRFKATITDLKEWESPLLKVVKLTNKGSGNPSTEADDQDTEVLQDYAGNFLIEPANYDGNFTDGNLSGDHFTSRVNTKIDWAQLSIDNTKPDILFRYENQNATDAVYRKSGKITIDATDSQLMDQGQPSTLAPSKGIYRPSNMTGSSAPTVGLVYYYWSDKPEDPFLGKDTVKNFAAVKRFSLSAKQPVELDSNLSDVTLKVANNKTNLIAPPPGALQDGTAKPWYLHTWTADMTWDSARELKQYEKMKTYIKDHPTEYANWIAAAPGSEADKIVYANNEAMKKVGDYGDILEWKVEDFQQEDSNWTYKRGTILYDNQVPSITFGTINGDGTSIADVMVSVTDPHSGVALNSDSNPEIKYMWVKSGEQPTGPDWSTAVLTAGTVNLNSINKIVEDGDYVLAVKAIDQAGNEAIQTSRAVKIDSNALVPGNFETTSNLNIFKKSHNVEFRIKGIGAQTVSSVTYATYSQTVTDSTYGTYVAFSLSSNSTRPEDNSAYTTLTAFDLKDDYYHYDIPVDSTYNGVVYVHMKIRVVSDLSPVVPDRFYYFSKEYYFDNLPPSVSFSTNGVPYPQSSQKVTIAVSEQYGQSPTTLKYIKQESSLPAPTESSTWTLLPPERVVTIDNDGFADGEEKDFKLYILAEDQAGNRIIKATTGIFKITKVGLGAAPAPIRSNLIYLYGDQTEGYTAVIKVDIDSVDKEGYEYSVSSDGGESWLKWKPYTNFVAVKVPTKNAADLKIQFKVRTPFGVIGNPMSMTTIGSFIQEPVYALASLSTTRPVNSSTGVDIFVAPPLGIRAVASAANPSVPVRTGNTFHVTKNGYYSFDLTDLADPTRTDKLYIVVANIDDVAPIGSVEKLVPDLKTNGNVPVRLNTNEPVQITNNGGKSIYTFTENNTFTFEFKDEAGNVGYAPVTVDSIDREGPEVKIIRSFAYGENHSLTYGTIKDAQDNVLYAQGVTLEVVKKNASSKDFIVPNGGPTLSVKENGTYSFQAVDPVTGNVTVVEETIENFIVNSPPAVTNVHYEFVDDNGNPVDQARKAIINGKEVARGQVKVTLSGTTTPDNPVITGLVPIYDENDAVTNRISDSSGAFSYSRVYGSEGKARIALSDKLGNVNRVEVNIGGLDNKAPELQLKMPITAVQRNKADFNFKTDLGGYSVSDNFSASENIKVTISGLDLTQTGRYDVTYTAVDQVGNETVAKQSVFVVDQDGVLVFANDILISSSIGETALFDTNKLTFRVLGFEFMEVDGVKQVNERATYDVYYQDGLYREGIMKNIATKLTYQQLKNGQYKVTFPKTGWYTIIVRSQERDREFATFFIGGMQ